MLGIAYAKRSLKGATRGSESCNPPRRFCTRLLQQGSPFGPTFGGYNSPFPRSRLYSLAPARLALRVHLRWLQLDLPMVSFVLACSSKACFGSTYGGYNSTFPWSHFSGLVHLSFSLFRLFRFQASFFPSYSTESRTGLSLGSVLVHSSSRTGASSPRTLKTQR